jgi:hypothetical protein
VVLPSLDKSLLYTTHRAVDIFGNQIKNDQRTCRMNMMNWVLGGVALAGLAACGDGVDVTASAFETNLTTFAAQSQVAALVDGSSTGGTASYATLVAQGAATYTGPVAINLDDTALLGETLTGETELNTPDLLGAANIRTAFGDTGGTVEGEFTDFVGNDGIEYSGSLVLDGGGIGSSFDGSGGTTGNATVGGALTGAGDGAGVYTARVGVSVSEDGSDVLIRGGNVDGEPGRDFIFTAAGTIETTN